jgi:hypothetical protein
MGRIAFVAIMRMRSSFAKPSFHRFAWYISEAQGYIEGIFGHRSSRTVRADPKVGGTVEKPTQGRGEGGVNHTRTIICRLQSCWQAKPPAPPWFHGTSWDAVPSETGPKPRPHAGLTALVDAFAALLRENLAHRVDAPVLCLEISADDQFADQAGGKHHQSRQ